MDKFTTLTGVAAPLPMINIDTDMIIPKQYLKTIKRTGLGTALFAEMRYNEDGTENPDFVLNKAGLSQRQDPRRRRQFRLRLVREHAPWALLDFGIRCVISTSFADIFYNNCFKNGILPIKVTPEQLALLLDDAERGANADAHRRPRSPDHPGSGWRLDPFRHRSGPQAGAARRPRRYRDDAEVRSGDRLVRNQDGERPPPWLWRSDLTASSKLRRQAW
ncbi:3-isopropylmalate dehydratase small subunit [Devosia ginsengisoli]|uniref:3-isopropylmalate dehydratase small subunit n=1 Tax=Devosia ginsengisoli TaxID=400770 RepID=UPI0026EB2332|nr:3-isopropylmalate dehydratase small subunit [Devosia ginsengisoli]MCR6671516.1 3-isopropylmalate dehydratase small subunit [Devosia ginsengisoli]